MLQPAQLYKEELLQKHIKTWYTKENFFYNGWIGETLNDLLENDNKDRHIFVSLDKNNEIIGLIYYNIDWICLNAYYFHAISYKSSIIYAEDVYKAVCNCFEKFGLNRIEWRCIADNPVIRTYKKFIEKHGGCQCGYLREATRMQDGKMHDFAIFEILAKEFKK